MGKFLPHYLAYDVPFSKIKEEYDLKLLFGLWTYHYEFTNIHFPEPKLELKDTKIKFTDFYDRPMLKVSSPTVKEWKISARQKVNHWILPQESDIEFNI